MFNWFRKSAATAPQAPRQAGSFFSTHRFDRPNGSLVQFADVMRHMVNSMPRVAADAAMDDSGNGSTLKMAASNQNSIPEVLAMWYASQGFIGHQLAAIVAQQWLVKKACEMPGRDAIRNGYDVVSVDGDDLDPEAVKVLNQYDRKYRLKHNLREFIHLGRVFGIRIAFFKVDSTDKDYYEKPFNADGITEGSYKGIVQVDPYWCSPMLTGTDASEPDSPHFYEPTYWQINGKKYHRSHLIIFRNGALPDLLKPQYLYGGIPVPQLIMERVYGAERTANEAPQLAMTKRATVWRTDMAAFAAAGDDAIAKLNDWVNYRDNYSVKLGDKEGDDIQQFDTSLADLDSVIMTQYQLVAAAANVPATKLLGTTPKGFNSTGEYDESSYHEELESLQEHDLTPFVERHHMLVLRSFAAGKADKVETTVTWRPVDSPTAKELADTNLIKAQTGAALVQSGAIGSDEERERISMDPTSGYPNLGVRDPEQDDPEVMRMLAEADGQAGGGDDA